MKKVLVMGGTGAMGTYLVPYLADMGHMVDVVSLDDVKSEQPNIRYIKENAKDDEYLKSLLTETSYDGIVDFLIYSTQEFFKRYRLLLDHTKHYIFLSTYRIYANEEHPIRETSPRLLDASMDGHFLSTAEGEYSLYKARQENILRNSDYKNWTIIRPAITFSKFRYQLVTLEANIVVHRALAGKKVLLPEGARNVQATMSWAGDVARMISLLLWNEKAYCEAFTVATAEHNTWETVAEYYKELIGLDYAFVEDETYLKCFHSSDGARYQLLYDRCFDRIIDNTKILSVTGMKQSELMPLKQGLALELSNLPKNHDWGYCEANTIMDELVQELKL